MLLLDALRPTPSPLVAQGTRTVCEMLRTSGEMFDAATATALDNAPLTADLGAMDETVNAGEREVRRHLLEHLAVSPQDDLSWSLLLLTTIQDAERCGDLAKSIAKAAGLADAPREGPHAETLRQLRDRVRPMFAHTCEAVTSGDADAARQVMLTNDELKGAMADLLGAIAHDGALTPNAATVLTLTTRMIGRVASHLSNIASAVALPFDLVRSGPEAQAAPSA